MLARLSALVLVVALAGCQWEGRPDGADANHSSSDGYYEAEGEPQATALGGATLDDGAFVEPLDADGLPALGPAREAPVPLDQPAPTTGTFDTTTEVEEALTPGTER